MIKFVSLATCSLMLTSSAMAVDVRPEAMTARDRYVAEFGVGPAASLTGEGLCVKACAADPNPCDPVLFKRADGRCSQQ